MVIVIYNLLAWYLQALTSWQGVKVVNELKKGILNYSKPAVHVFRKALSHLIDLVFDSVEKAMIFKDAGSTMPGRVRDIFKNLQNIKYSLNQFYIEPFPFSRGTPGKLFSGQLVRWFTSLKYFWEVKQLFN